MCSAQADVRYVQEADIRLFTLAGQLCATSSSVSRYWGSSKARKDHHVIELAIPSGGIFVAQLSLNYLAGFFARQHVPKFDHVGNLEIR